jgi:peptide/nickel transport system permease protein
MLLGVVGGIAGAVFCASRPRSAATRAVEATGLLFYSLPAYLFGFGLLLLFDPTFGVFPLPVFFHQLDYEEPFADPWAFVEAMVVPWSVLALPFAAVVMRLMQAGMLQTLETDYVRAASARGLSRRRVIRRHAAPPSYLTVASLIATWIPSFVTNMVLVEFVFYVPGFFGQTKRALGQIKELPPGYDIPMLEALALWAAVLIVVTSALADCALIMLDPRVRETGQPVG